MSLTTTPTPPQTGIAQSTSTRRVGAVAAVLFAAALFTTVASMNVPHNASDVDLLRWWQQSGNRTSGLISGVSAVCAGALFAVVVNHIRSLEATSKAPQWLAFARSMAAAVTAVWLVTGAARAAVGHLVDVMGEPLPGLDTLRLITAFNYTLLGLSGMAALGAAIFAISMVVLATRALGRWIGVVGGLSAIVIIGAVLLRQGAYATPVAIGWALCLAVAIWREPRSGRSAGSDA